MATNQLPELIEAPVSIVLMEDDLLHTDERPFCGNPDCLCVEDAALVREYITEPLQDGLLTDAEAMRLYWGRQVFSHAGMLLRIHCPESEYEVL